MKILRGKLKYVVVFLIVFLLATSLGFIGFFWLESYFNATAYEEFSTVYEPEVFEELSEEEQEKIQLDELYGKEKRINILMAGIEETRTDTLMVFSYDQQENRIDIISVPRDTYVDYGFEGLGRKKINSVYGYPGSRGGMKSTASAVSRVLGVPIHEYVAVDYNAVREVVNELGGVDVNIPFRMNYDDPRDVPPLHIHFKPGPKRLNGQEAVEYLRWRKNNNDNGDGDLGRIKRQQDFVLKVLQKSLYPTTFPNVVKVGLENTKTSMDLKQALYYAGKAATMDRTKMYTYTIEGDDVIVDDLWHFKHDVQKTRKLMKDIYSGAVPIQESEDKAGR